MADVAVIGAGASGLLCAGIAARNGKSVLLIERNAKPGRKLLITGKGRCNITNFTDINGLISAVTSNQRFLYSAFSNFSAYDTVAFFEELGIATKVERGDRVFPVSDRAVDVVDALHRFCISNGVKIINGRAVDFICDDNKIVSVVLDNGTDISADNFVLATGGRSYPKTGSSGDGYILAQKCGHTVTELIPSLVPLCIREGFVSELMGVSLRNTAIKVVDTVTDKVIYTDFGEMLFTHFGVSGPMILSASAHMRNMNNGRYKIHIDLKPALDEKKLDARLLRDFKENANKDFINALCGLLPKKMVPVIVRLSAIAPSTKVNQISREQRARLCGLLKDLQLTVTDFRPIDEAIITSGGISVKEVDPKTMHSKLCGNLYFAGEILDVDAYTGGFNLQIAFSTAYTAANSI